MMVLSEVVLAWLPGRKDPIHPLGGAANEQQRQGGEQTEQDGARTQPAGAAHRQVQPSHQKPAQDCSQYSQWDTDSSWETENRCDLHEPSPGAPQTPDQLTDHHGGKRHSLAELSLNELGHEGRESSQKGRLVDLG